ncbi:MAG: hypothetical protein PHH28_11770 [Desulfuromonadaceae bacterium]|nr:hypothetical protein [Desulfuromonadaceae bacterium]
MKTRAIVKPGQNGTKKFVEKYGDTLVCVRYRYDAEKRKQYKTIEIIVSESDWTPPPSRFSDSTLISLKIGIKDTSAQAQVRAVGGRWDREKKFWYVPYGCIAGTKLEKFLHIETEQRT